MSESSNTAKITEERQHHPYSPSTLQAREACSKYKPRQGTSAAAEDGTRQHDSAEAESDDPRLTDVQAFAVAQCLDFVKKREAAYPGCTVLKEVYLPVDDEVLLVDGKEWRGTTAGYVDHAIISADETQAEVNDYKYGKWAVEEASNNVQGIAYALGLKRKFPKLRSCVVTFQMPHRDEISTHTFDLTNPAELYLRVVTIVRRAIEAHKDPDDFSMATPTISGCLFCSLIGRCTKVTDIALRIGKKFAPMQVPDSVNPSLILDPAQASLGMRVAQVVATWAEAFKRQATAKTIEDSKFIPEGYQLVPSQKRIVKDARKLGEIAKQFVPPEQHSAIEKLYDISIGPLEKLISLAAPRGQKEKTVEAFGEKIEADGAVELGQPFAYLKQSTK